MGNIRIKILNHIAQQGIITTREAVNMFGGSYEHGADRYIGEALTRLCKAGLLKRLKRGAFVKNEEESVGIGLFSKT